MMEAEPQLLLPLFTPLSFNLSVSEYSGRTLPLCSQSDALSSAFPVLTFLLGVLLPIG